MTNGYYINNSCRTYVWRLRLCFYLISIIFLFVQWIFVNYLRYWDGRSLSLLTKFFLTFTKFQLLCFHCNIVFVPRSTSLFTSRCPFIFVIRRNNVLSLSSIIYSSVLWPLSKRSLWPVLSSLWSFLTINP